MVTERLKNELEKIKPTCCDFDMVEITISEQFSDLYPEREIPKFFWMKIDGEAGADDLGISEDNMLVVSERILNVLNQFHLKDCNVDAYVENSEIQLVC